MNGGHYTSAVLNNGSWYEYNDSVVEKITEAQVRSQAAYILFYKRRGVDANTSLEQVVPKINSTMFKGMPLKFQLTKDSKPLDGYLIEYRANKLCQLVVGLGANT